MNAVYFDEVGEYHLDRATKLLAGIPGGVYQAVGSAVKRSAQHGLTVGMKIVSQEYAIGQDQLKKYTKNINTVVNDGAGSYEVTFGYRGNVIPLIQFDTNIDRSGRVATRVIKSSAKKILDHAFVAHVGAHTGIFERETEKRMPITEKFGPSAVQAFYVHEETVDEMNTEIIKTYESRIDHEIDRVLNGWGGK